MEANRVQEEDEGHTESKVLGRAYYAKVQFPGHTVLKSGGSGWCCSPAAIRTKQIINLFERMQSQKENCEDRRAEPR